MPELKNYWHTEESKGILSERTLDQGSAPTANISMRMNEMGLTGPKNPQLPRGFDGGARTPETAEIHKIGL